MINKDHVILVTKNPPVHFYFLSFSSSSGLNFPIVIVSSMYFALAIHYQVAYYAYIDFTVHFVSLGFLSGFLILPVMTMLAPVEHLEILE